MITDERILGENFNSIEEYFTYLRHLFAYEFANKHIPARSSILEIGCGSGYGTNLLSKNAEKIIGLDVDKSTVERVSKRYNSKNCFFELYDGIRIPYADESFDVAVSFQVIEHIKNDKNIIKEIWRILKPGGIMIMTTPNRVFRLIGEGQKPTNKFHIREYSPMEFEGLLKTNFLNVKVSGIRGTEDVQEIEKNNVIISRKITRIDPLDLRRFLPEFLKQVISKNIKEIIGNVKPGAKPINFLKTYSTNDYSLINSDTKKEAIDLVAVCKK